MSIFIKACFAAWVEGNSISVELDQYNRFFGNKASSVVCLEIESEGSIVAEESMRRLERVARYVSGNNLFVFEASDGVKTVYCADPLVDIEYVVSSREFKEVIEKAEQVFYFGRWFDLTDEDETSLFYEVLKSEQFQQAIALILANGLSDNIVRFLSEF